MSEEDLYKYYRRKTKDEIIEELLYKCNANYYLISKINKAIEKLKEKENYFIQMSEVLLDRIDFYEDFENDKSCWIEELQRDREKLQDKIDETIKYIEKELKDMPENGCSIRLNKILDILKGGEENE